jgi:hypothetical protein
MDAQDELAFGRNQKMEVVWVVLAVGEGFETVQDLGVEGEEFLEAAGMEVEGLPGESGVAVGQKTG